MVFLGIFVLLQLVFVPIEVRTEFFAKGVARKSDVVEFEESRPLCRNQLFPANMATVTPPCASCAAAAMRFTSTTPFCLVIRARTSSCPLQVREKRNAKRTQWTFKPKH
jgi:hypothetical protein